MSDTFHEQSVKASRKTRRCNWCGELIEIGQPYESYRWRDGSDGGTVRMHPECLEARRRGKSWGEMDEMDKTRRGKHERAGKNN